MAFTLRSLFGLAPAKTAGAETEMDMPTTQVKMSALQQGYDPLASVSAMDQARTGLGEIRQPCKLWLLGHLPTEKQSQLLVALLLVFLILTGGMAWLNARLATQSATSASVATEMQMLSQRLARGTALAVQGNAGAFESVKDSRDRFRANLDALSKGGTVRGVTIDPAGQSIQSLVTELNNRWERTEKNAT